MKGPSDSMCPLVPGLNRRAVAGPGRFRASRYRLAPKEPTILRCSKSPTFSVSPGP